ncbi:B-cell scaffold protein with ankyrin repeats [Nothobranchius furzeri]|nr:B-cell scaffold protein with ankyrin repeats [Nothobranchius furzeri]
MSSRRDDFLRLSSYKCKLLILTEGMLESLCQMRRFFLSRVLSPAACVVVLLCGVDSLTPLLELVPLDGEECLQISSEQDAPDYMASVIDIVRKGACRTSGSEQKAQQMHSSGADGVRSNIVVIPSRVPCRSCTEVFVLLKNEEADDDCEVEFSGRNQKVRVKPVRWNERILYVGAPDFPAGNVRVTVYSSGKPLCSSQLQYYTSIEELTCLLSNVADPVQFMCQALQVSCADKLDQKLSSMLLQGMPKGGFQGLRSENTHERDLHREDVPSFLHFAARYGFRGVSGLLLQCPGAERALRTTNCHGQTPPDIAKSHGHMELHVLLKETLKTFNTDGGRSDGSIYEMMCNAGINQQPQDEDQKGGDDDLYTMLGKDNDCNSVEIPKRAMVLANRPPAPTPRPEGVQVKDSKTPYIAQVFKKKKKTPRGGSDVHSLSPTQTPNQETSTYDTFVPNQLQGLERLVELQHQVKAGSLTMDQAVGHFRDWQRDQKGVDAKKEEKRSHLRANMIDNRDSGVYDKINIVHQTPSATVYQSHRGNQLDSEFYSMPVGGQRKHRKADKR